MVRRSVAAEAVNGTAIAVTARVDPSEIFAVRRANHVL
jgi:hypothetical protein